MKKLLLILLVTTLLMVTGCNNRKKDLYLPEVKNDKMYTTIGGENKNEQKKSENINLTVTANGEKSPVEATLHETDDYSIYIPTKDYSYEKDYDDGNIEEKWEHITKDDVEIKITTYMNSDEITARSKFLKDNDDYVFEDLMGYSLCGMEADGDTLWFCLYEAEGNVYILSWEYPKNTSESLKTELSEIVETFTIAE